VAARQVVQRAASPGSGWTNVYTNEPPTAVTNTWMTIAPESEAYFRIKAGP